MELYHADIRLPDGFEMPTHRVELKWTRHADRARLDDRYGEIPRFATIPLSQFKVVEVGVDMGRVCKIVVRGHFRLNEDVIFVLIPNRSGPWTVKTVWKNLRTDSHSTLDHSRYVC